MLDLKKFENSYIIKIVGGFKEVSEWNGNKQGIYRHGSDIDYFNCEFTIKENEINNIGTMIINRINGNNYSDIEENNFTIINNCITWNQIEDGFCNILNSKEEIEKEEYFICDYTVFISINGIELNEKKLREIFPNAN